MTSAARLHQYEIFVNNLALVAAAYSRSGLGEWLVWIPFCFSFFFGFFIFLFFSLDIVIYNLGVKVRNIPVFKQRGLPWTINYKICHQNIGV